MKIDVWIVYDECDRDTIAAFDNRDVAKEHAQSITETGGVAFFDGFSIEPTSTALAKAINQILKI